MLRKIYRISTSVYKTLSGRTTTHHSLSFIVYIYKNIHNIPTQYAIVCSKKVDSRSVMRNRIRRRIYSIIKKHTLSTSFGFYIVFVCKKNIMETTYPNLSLEVEKVLALYACR